LRIPSNNLLFWFFFLSFLKPLSILPLEPGFVNFAYFINACQQLNTYLIVVRRSPFQLINVTIIK